MSTLKESFKILPAMDKLLAGKKASQLLPVYGKDALKYALNKSIDHYREQISNNQSQPTETEIFNLAQQILDSIFKPGIKKVINATGIIIHTNLGRAPMKIEYAIESLKQVSRYSNLEFNLEKATRGNRNNHLEELLQYLTGAESFLVVNNNAAALLLILRSMARKKEVIISRGELVEIGDSFRLPDIMAASDCKMKEVGTTNKTKLNDYEKAISNKTSILLKIHKSNFAMNGFTEEVNLHDMVKLGKTHSIPVVFDLGSGLLQQQSIQILQTEPDVKNSLSTGVDLICFSADKLMGGPQAGIIVGKKIWIDKLKKDPLFRALRVGKFTLALLENLCKDYAKKSPDNELLQLLNKPKEQILKVAQQVQKKLQSYKIDTSIEPSQASCGGGTLPNEKIESYCLHINIPGSNKQKELAAEKLYRELCLMDEPVVAIIKKGKMCFDLLTVADNEIDCLCDNIYQCMIKLKLSPHA